MTASSQDDRLRAELTALEALRAASTILTFTTEGEPPERYNITFRGQGVCRAGGGRSGVEVTQVHRLEVRLPFGYPEHPPDVRWLTPIMHPNISYSGCVNLDEIGLDWTPEITLDALCERLWDVARLAYVNSAHPSNFAAQKWVDEQTEFSLPLDPRPLRDIAPTSNPNVIHYSRRDGQFAIEAEPASDVLFIDDNTPTPRVPRRGGDDILYIE